MIELKIDIEGLQEFSRRLDITANQLKRPRGMLDKVGTKVVEETKGYFDQWGNEQGKWNALSPRTVMMRKRRWGYYKRPGVGWSSRPVLVWTGRLKKGFKHQATSRHVRIYNDVPYFRYHQTRHGERGSLPRRKMLALWPKLNAAIAKIMQQHIYEINGGIFSRTA